MKTNSETFSILGFSILFFLNFSPFFVGYKYLKFFVFFFFVFFVFKKKLFSNRLLMVLIINQGLIIIQGVIFGFNIITFFTYPFFLFIIPHQIYKYNFRSFCKHYIDFIFAFSMFTTVVWFFEKNIYIVRSFINVIVDRVFLYSSDLWPRSIIIYTSVKETYSDIARNAGIAHEPGMWAYFLILALVMNNIINKEFFSVKNIIFMLVVLTTYSTTGYMSLFIILTLWLFSYNKQRNLVLVNIGKILLLPIAVVSFYLAYSTADFLGEKIDVQMEEQLSGNLTNRYSTGRFIYLRKALNLAIKYPLTGKGIISASAEESRWEEEFVAPGSLLTVFSNYGFIFGFMYYYLLYKGSIIFGRIHKVKGILLYQLIVVILVNSFSQAIITNWFSMIIFFYGLYYKKHQKECLDVQK